MTNNLAHVMLRVGDPERAIEFYKDAFGWERKRTVENDTFTLYFIGPPDQQAEIELTHNHGENKPYEKARGFGHIAVRTEKDQSLQKAYDKAVDAGAQDYRPPSKCPGNYAFVKDPEGFEVEIVA